MLRSFRLVGSCLHFADVKITVGVSAGGQLMGAIHMSKNVFETNRKVKHNQILHEGWLVTKSLVVEGDKSGHYKGF